MENLAIARIFSEIADLLEIKSENPFKIRAYRNASETIAHATDKLAYLTEEQLRAIPGIGKDLASKIREIAETGEARYHQDLLEQFPPTILDLLHLQGVGPKTVALLYTELGIKTIEELEAACGDGRVRGLKGLGPKKEQLILRACAERKQHSGRHLLPDAAEAAALLLDYLRAECPTVVFDNVGSIRRGADTSGDIDILATGNDPSRDDDVHDVQARGADPRPGRHQIERAALGRHSGGSPARARGEPRRRHAVFHRIEIAQHRAARSEPSRADSS